MVESRAFEFKLAGKDMFSGGVADAVVPLLDFANHDPNTEAEYPYELEVWPGAMVAQIQHCC